MFTGIVEDVGIIEELAPGPKGGLQLRLRTGRPTDGLAIGDSIAVDGVCLTAVELAPRHVRVDVGPETLARTTLGAARAGTEVNLERALALGDRLGGHLVLGHVDGLARLERVESRENAYDLTLRAPRSLAPMIAAQGSVALDGVSLTVTAVDGDVFRVSLIPHTWAVTTLGRRAVPRDVHLEVDVLARYLHRMLTAMIPGAREARLEGLLAAAGLGAVDRDR